MTIGLRNTLVFLETSRYLASRHRRRTRSRRRWQMSGELSRLREGEAAAS